MKIIFIFLSIICSFVYLQSNNCDETWQDSPTATNLWNTISRGSLNDVKSMINNDKCLAFLRTRDGRGPLFWAYEFGHQEIIQYLELIGVPNSVKDEHDFTPLDLKDIGKMKKDFNANIPTENFNEPSPIIMDDQKIKQEQKQDEPELPFYIYQNFLTVKNKFKIAKTFLEISQVPNDNTIEVSDGVIKGSKIFKEIIEGNDKEVKKLIKKNKKLINEKFIWRSEDDESKMSGNVLFFLIIFDKVEIIEYLMFADIISKSNFDEEISVKFSDITLKGPSISVAICKGDLDLVELMINNGVDVNSKFVLNNQKLTLFQGSYLDMNEKIVEFLIEKGCKCDAKLTKKHGILDLYSEIHHGFRNIVNSLIENKKEKDSETEDFLNDFQDNDDDDDDFDDF